MKYLALPFVWLAGAWAPIVWGLKYHLLGYVDRDALRAAGWFGWRVSVMRELYARTTWRGHDLMNLITEWTKLDAQRAQKFAALLVWLAFLIGVLI